MIRILLDSGADTSQDIQETYRPTFVPLTVILENKEYRDRIDISLEEIHRYMRQGHFPKTSQISPQDTIDAIEEAAKAGDSVIFVAIFSQLSGSYQVAVNAMADVQERYPDFKGAVVDSKSAAGGQTLLYLTGMEMVKKGYSFEDILAQLEESAEDLLTYLAVEDLNWLAKGGRLPAAVGKVGSMLKVKPLLTLDDTGIVKKSLVRGKDRVYLKLLDELIKQIDSYDGQVIVISHVAQMSMAEKLRDKVLKALPNAQVQIYDVSAVIACHAGIGGLGVFAFKKQPKHFIPIKIEMID